MRFDMPKEQSSIIKVIGVGGGGSNAVTHMYKQGIKDVNFVICNTDAQAMDLSPVPNKTQLGPGLTEGRGAGSMPEVGKKAADESLDDIKSILQSNTKMVFVTAGMGGGTGTGGAPVIAKLAKEMGILTVGIVTTPFTFEGKKRVNQADEGIDEMKENVDTFLVISNDKLREIHGNLTLSNAFAQADSVLATAAKGIAEIITMPGYVNVDFEDVRTVMQDSGVAIMGSAEGEGEDRALRGVETALASPLLNDNNIKGAQHILLNITSGTNEVTMDEISEITDYIQAEAGNDTDLIWGNCHDERLEDKLSVTVIATGFEGGRAGVNSAKDKVVIPLDESKPEGDQGSDTEMSMEQKPVVEFDLSKPEEPTFEPQTRSNTPPNQEEQTKESEEMHLETKEKTPTEPSAETETSAETEASAETEPSAKTETQSEDERTSKLRNLSLKLNNTGAMSELEKEPAYLRRKVELEDQPRSNDSQISRFTLKMDENDEPEFRENNSFLHDNVD